jgi:hypothetical protein
MLKFTLDQENNQLIVEQEPPYQDMNYARTAICIQPDPCPGCGQCRLCDSKCRC